MKILRSAAIYSLRGVTLLLAVSVIVFILASASPIDPETRYRLSHPGLSDENAERMREYWGVDESPVRRYIGWLSGILHGNWGESTAYRRPVLEVIGARFLASLPLMLTAWTLSGLLGLAAGSFMSVFRESRPDRALRRVCLILRSVPAFWVGLIFLSVFSASLGWLPFGLAVPPGVTADMVTLGQRIRHLILPALTLSLVSFSGLALHTREKLVSAYMSDYALFARARGESDALFLLRHGLRNALAPVLTMQLGSFAELFGGSVFTETVFGYPGLFAAAATAGRDASDIPLLLGIVVFSACFVFLGNLAANMLTRLIDPRTGEEIG